MKHLLILVFASIIGYNLFGLYHEYSFLDLAILIPCLIFVSIFFINFIKDFTNYLKSSSILNFSSTFLALFLVLFLYLFYLNLDYKLKKESLIVFEYISDINGTKIDLKKDNTCVVNNYSNIGGSYLYGNYVIKDSIIEIKNIADYPKKKFHYSPQDSIVFPYKNKSKIDYSQKFTIK